jgi:hypothetical protein
MSCSPSSVPEIDASAGRIDLRMTEGDPIPFSWLVQGAADWAGASFTAEVRDSEGAIIPLTVVVTAQGLDALIVLSHVAIPTLLPTRSGYAWAMREIGGYTKFAGLLRVEALP